MNRIDIYSLEQIRLFDIMWSVKDALEANGWSNRLTVGQNEGVWHGFPAAQTSTPSLQINLGEGWIYYPADVDLTPWSAFAADTTIIMQQGYAPTGVADAYNFWTERWRITMGTRRGFVHPSGHDSGGNANTGILPYLNSAVPTQPLNGPNNDGLPQNTERAAIATVAVKYGAPSSGSPMAPAPDSGCLPMYLILLTNGQTAITNGDILLAGPNAYSGYQVAPYCPGLTGTVPNATGGSHHGGVAGQANKILLTGSAEVTGIAALANLPVTNTLPPVTGGSITLGGEIPILSQGTVVPTGNVAGNVGDFFFNVNTGILYQCTTSGSSSGAVWAGLSTGDTVVYKAATFTPLAGGNIYLCDSGPGSFAVTLPTAASFAGTTLSFKNIGVNEITVNPQAGESIEGGAAGAGIVLQRNQALKLGPLSGTGWFIVS